LLQIEDEARENAENSAIVMGAIQKCATDLSSEMTVTTVALPNDEMKGRIIGREGRNIRSIESVTGVELIVDDTPEAITISSFDPIRREIARLSLEKLIVDGRIHPTRAAITLAMKLRFTIFIRNLLKLWEDLNIGQVMVKTA